MTLRGLVSSEVLFPIGVAEMSPKSSCRYSGLALTLQKMLKSSRASEKCAKR